MRLIARFTIKTALNGIILYIAWQYLPGFIVQGGNTALLIAAAALTFLNMVIKPVLRLVTTPLRWLTFGLFSIVIHVAVLAIADAMLDSIHIVDLTTLIGLSLIIAIINSFV